MPHRHEDSDGHRSRMKRTHGTCRGGSRTALFRVQLKDMEKLMQVHQAHQVTHLKLSGIRLGLLSNFNVPSIKDGIKKTVLVSEL